MNLKNNKFNNKYKNKEIKDLFKLSLVFNG